MKSLLSIFAIVATTMLAFSCQKELPDAIKNIDVSQGEKTPSQTPSSTPTPENPTQQGNIPTEDDNPWPGY